MDFVLSPVEVRVLGCLIEKEILTPDYYPLTLNSLVNACNQKSSREPVMELDENAVANALFELRQKKLANQVDTIGYRVSKFEHCMDQAFDFSDEELAVVCLMFLRGPQTPGEIRTRSARFCQFSSPAEVEAVFQKLADREEGPFVVRLPRQPGKRECRYAHLFSGEIDVEQMQEASPPPSFSASQLSGTRVDELEKEVSELRSEMETLRRDFDEFVKQFE